MKWVHTRSLYIIIKTFKMFLNIKSMTLLPHQRGYGKQTPRVIQRTGSWKGWIPVQFGKDWLAGEINWQKKN